MQPGPRYEHVKPNEAGEIPADQLLEWLYGDGQGARMLPHLEVPGGATPRGGGDSPGGKSARTEKDIEAWLFSEGFHV